MKTKKEFTALYKAHSEFIRNVVQRRISNEQDVEDIVQDTFLKAWRARSSFEQRCRSRTWLSGIAINACRDFYRSRQAKPALPLEREPVSSQRVDAGVENRELTALLLLFAKSLGEKQHQMMKMTYEGTAPGDIEAVLDIHRNTRYSWLRSIRAYATKNFN